MKRKLSIPFTLLMILLLAAAVTGCGQPAGEEAAANVQEAAEEAVEEVAEEGAGEEAETAAGTTEAVIGFTASQTGNLTVESTNQINGLNLCMAQIEEAGGIPLADGTRVTFSSVYYDDESNTDRVQELYTRLATEDNADFLISPYSSGLADAAAVISEQYGKVMITTGAASDTTYQKGFSNVFQAYTPASRYLTGALDLLGVEDPDARKIAIIYENTQFSTDVAAAAQAYAQELGYEIVLYEGYDTNTTDFAPFINRIVDSAPDAILGGGHFQDGSTFVKQLHEKNVDVKMVVLLVAPPEPSFAELGEAAIGVIGPSQWEPQADFNPEAASEAGMEFYGPSSGEFTEMFVAEYGEDPSYHAAGGYVACLLLQKAIEDAGSLDSSAVRDALDAMDVVTFFGHMQFDTSPENHGLQTGHSMVYIQWQEKDGELVKEVVWPAEGATAETLYPLP
ncbi:MAG: ABC transporter substrate-binding protein [Chloroflexi bacterium]|nr:ABC transporter substrate-binding protein [Chloroflexota bacterium]